MVGKVQVFAASAFSAALLLGAQGAQAGCFGSSCRPVSCQGSGCYNLVQTPPVYDTVGESVMVRPEQSQARVVPARYEFVNDTIEVAPARKIAHQRPAQYQSVQETVMVSPATRRWEVTRDAWGRTTGCWVDVPAQYGVQTRTVMVQPASVDYEIVPAVYETRQRRIMVSPTQVLHETRPAVYETRYRKVLVSPGSQYWAKSGY